MKYAFIICICILVISFIAVIGLWARRSSANNKKQADVPSAGAQNPWLGLRTMALNIKPSEMGLQPGNAESYGFIMEMGMTDRNAKATIVAFRDGTISMYLSTGGGTIGVGQRSPEAAELGKQVVAAVGDYTNHLEITTDLPIAGTDRVRFYIMTGHGTYTAEVDRKAVEQQSHPLFPLFVGGQKLLTVIRLASENAAPPK